MDLLHAVAETISAWLPWGVRNVAAHPVVDHPKDGPPQAALQTATLNSNKQARSNRTKRKPQPAGKTPRKRAKAAYPSALSVDSFFHLSRDIHITVLLEWIPFGADYSALDVAMSSHGIRELWLELLRDPVLRVGLSFFETAPKCEYYKWLVLRQLDTAVLHLSANKDCRYIYDRFCFSADVGTVMLMGNETSDVDFSSGFGGLANVLKRFANLTKLTSRSFAGSLGSDSLPNLSTLTAPLKVLELVEIDAGDDNAYHRHRKRTYNLNLCVFALVYRFGSTLEVLHLNIVGMATYEADTGELMEQIGFRCPLLRALRLPGIVFHYQDVLDLSESHAHLTALECRVDFSRCNWSTIHKEACGNIMEKFRDLELLSVLGCRAHADSLQLDEHPKLKVFATDQLCVNVSTDNSSFTVNANIDTGVDAQVVCQMLLDVTTPVKTIAYSGNRRPYFSCYVDQIILPLHTSTAPLWSVGSTSTV